MACVCEQRIFVALSLATGMISDSIRNYSVSGGADSADSFPFSANNSLSI
jgi:hypothetical protein